MTTSPQPTQPELVVTNLHRNFTGVSATIDQLLRYQEQQFNVQFLGTPLPAVKTAPTSIRKAVLASRQAPPGRSHVIWHVRRNNEMFWALFARDVMKCPIKIVFTSAAIRRHSAYPRALISRMDAVIATSEKAAALVPNVVSVVPHGVDVERFRPVHDRAAAWQASGFPGRLGIATVGRIRPEKGTDLFVKAMIRTLPSRPDWTALVIGKAEARFAGFKANLQRQIAEAGLENRIIFTGEIKKANLPATLAALSLFVAVPRYEGYGMTPLEAMASGTPVVVSNTGAFSGFLEGGSSGILVPLEDLQQMTDAVRLLMDDSQRRESMASAARERAANRFSVTQELQGIEAVYRQIWDQPAVTHRAA